MKGPKLTARRGMTLMELLIVISIMGLLALVAIPKLVDVYEKSRSGVQSYSLADVARMIENHAGAYNKYPDGFDSLLNESDLATPFTRIHSNVQGMVAVHDLTAGQLAALRLAGISHVFTHEDVAPYSDSGTRRHHIGSSGTGHDGTQNVSKAVRIDPSTPAGLAVLQDLNLNANADVSTDSAFYTTNNIFLVFGVGPRSTLVGRTNQTAAIFEAADPSANYARALAIFMVPATDPTIVSKPARFVGVIGPDGRGIKDSINGYIGTEVH